MVGVNRSSMVAAAQSTFGWLDEVPVRGKVKRSLLEEVREQYRITVEVGGLTSFRIAASLMGLSNQRVHQFVKEGRFTVHEFGGQKFLELREIAAFMAVDRPKGRPSLKEAVKMAWRAGVAAASDDEK